MLPVGGIMPRTPGKPARSYRSLHQRLVNNTFQFKSKESQMTRWLPRFSQGSRSLVFPLFQLVTCLLILALSARAQTSLEQISTPAQKGFTGIFGGGPFYKIANFNVQN